MPPIAIFVKTLEVNPILMDEVGYLIVEDKVLFVLIFLTSFKICCIYCIVLHSKQENSALKKFIWFSLIK